VKPGTFDHDGLDAIVLVFLRLLVAVQLGFFLLPPLVRGGSCGLSATRPFEPCRFSSGSRKRLACWLENKPASETLAATGLRAAAGGSGQKKSADRLAVRRGLATKQKSPLFHRI
jgi:hypothetical protein